MSTQTELAYDAAPAPSSETADTPNQLVDVSALLDRLVEAFDASQATLQSTPNGNDDGLEEVNYLVARATRKVMEYHYQGAMQRYLDNISRMKQMDVSWLSDNRGLIDRLVTLGDKLRPNLSEDQKAVFDPEFEALVALQASPRVAGASLSIG